MSDQEIILRRGQVGTVVEEYQNGEAFEIEFSDLGGQTYALLTVKSNSLIPLYYDLVGLNVR